MLRNLAAGMAALVLVTGLVSAAEQQTVPELETFVVSGEQPGPGLWKVSKGDHVMWILAAHGPLPKGMKWRSIEVEQRIAESQEVLYGGNINISPNIGIWRGLTLIPAALKASKIPDGKTLKDVVPPEPYAKWLDMRLRYIGKDDDIERRRPAIALEELRAAAMRKSGLYGGPNVHAVVGEIRKKHKVARVMLPAVSRTVRVEDPRGMLKSAQKLQLPDLGCFIEGLDGIETDVERARELSNAWATGDIAKLRSMHRDRNRNFRETLQEFCAFTLMEAMNQGDASDAAHMKKMMEDFQWHAELAGVQSQLDWVAAAQKAIAKNKSTFAVLSMGDIFRPDGHVEKLRELGYTIEAPG